MSIKFGIQSVDKVILALGLVNRVRYKGTQKTFLKV